VFLTSLIAKIKQMKKIITHTNPDIDAVAAVWLLKRYLTGWEEAEVGFVTTKGVDLPDKEYSEHTLYWCGFGVQLDHHQKNEFSCMQPKNALHIFCKKETNSLFQGWI